MSQYGTAVYGSNLYGSTAEHPYTLTAGKVMWMVQVDWDRDGAIGSEIEPQTIRKLKIRRGRGQRMNADGRSQAQPGNESFEVELLDGARRYDSFNTASPLYGSMGAPGLLVRIMAVSTTTRAAAQPVFVGTLTSVEYDSKTGIATLKGEGLAKYLEIGAAASVYAPCQSASLSAWDPYFVWDGSTPFPINYWKGRPNGLTLRECVGITLERAGWGLGSYYGAGGYNNDQPDYFYLDGSSAWDTLTDLADGFAARLFFLRDGRLFAMDRLDRNGLAYGLAAPTRAQEAHGLERISPFETLRNRAEVKVRPHSVMPFNNPIADSYYLDAWSNGGPIEVAPSSYVDIPIKYSGSVLQGNFVRANSDALSEIHKMAVWSKADRTGINMGPVTGNAEGEFSIQLQLLGANQYGLTYVQSGNNQSFCVARLRNWSAVRTAYFFDLQVQVVGLRETGAAMTKVVDDTASQALNGMRRLSIDSRWIQTPLMADSIGQSFLDALSTRERSSPATITYQWSGETLYNNLLSYDVGSHVDFGVDGGADALANFGIYGRWLIVGQEMQWMSADGQDALVKLTFEKPPLLSVQVTSTSIITGSSVTSVTWAHTLPDGLNRLLVVAIAKRDTGGSVTSVTWQGVALSQLATRSEAAGDFPRVELWYLVNPASGTGNLQATFSVLDFVEICALGLVNAHQTFPFGSPSTVVGASGGAGPAGINVTAEAGDLVLDAVCYRGAAGGAAGVGQLVRMLGSSDGLWRGGCSTKPGAPVVNMSWTIPAGGFAQIGAAVKKAE
jgi:hypothetical protein